MSLLFRAVSIRVGRVFVSNRQPPAKQQSAFGFVEETTDDVARKTFRNADELRFEKEQSRRRAPKQTEFPLPETGSCCARCQHYRPALKAENFGECAQMVITLVPVVTIAKGTILGTKEHPEIEADTLRCKPWGGQGCSAFAPIALEQAA